MSAENKDLETRFKSHNVDDNKRKNLETVRHRTKALAYLFDDLCPDSREKEIAISKLEEAMFWANASIARN